MKELVIKPGMRFLHAYFVESDLQTPLTMVITQVRTYMVYFTPAELWDAGNRAGTWQRDRAAFQTTSVKQWLT